MKKTLILCSILGASMLTACGGGGSSVPETGSLLVPALAMSALGLIQWRRRARRT